MSTQATVVDYYLITTRSNLHAGAGDKSFGLIDKLVQRDPTMRLPTIYSSSLKGALRELMTCRKPTKVTEIFGSDNRKGKEAKLKQGAYTFYDAQLLALPIRASQDFYYLATTPELLDNFINCCPNLPKDLKGAVRTLAFYKVKAGTPEYLDLNSKDYQGEAPDILLEDWTAEAMPYDDEYEHLTAILGKRIGLLSATDFAQLAEDLPTLARNALNNGISEQLWYEEVVPRKARFFTKIRRPDDQSLHAVIRHNDYEVQVGANATVGYGVTHWKRLNK